MTSIRSVSDASDNASEMKKLMPSLHRKMSYQDEDIELNYLIRGEKEQEQEQEGTVMETTKKVTTPVAFATLVTFCVVLLLFSFSTTSSTANTGMVSLDSLRVNDDRTCLDKTPVPPEETGWTEMKTNVQFFTEEVIGDGDDSDAFLELVPHNCLPPNIPVPVFAEDVLKFHFRCVDITNQSAEFVRNLFAPAKEVFHGTGLKSDTFRTALATAWIPMELMLGAAPLSARPLDGPFNDQDLSSLKAQTEEVVNRCVPLLKPIYVPVYNAMNDACTEAIGKELPEGIWSINQKLLTLASPIAYQSMSPLDTNGAALECFLDAFTVHQGMGFGNALGVDPVVATHKLKKLYKEKKGLAWIVGLDLVQHGLQVAFFYINDDPLADAVLEFTKWHWLSLAFMKQMGTGKPFPEYMTTFTADAFRSSFLPLMVQAN